MATAKKIPNDDFRVELSLSAEEARTLMLVVGRAGGPNRLRRGHALALYDTLSVALGQRSQDLPTNSNLSGHVRFEGEG